MRRALFGAAIVGSFVGFQAVAAESPASATKAAVSAEATTVTFTNKLINGQKVWTPGETKVKAGSRVELVLINELSDPHGFSAKEFGLKEDIVVGPNETKTIQLEAPKSGSYKVSCHMHPAHIGAMVTVQ